MRNLVAFLLAVVVAGAVAFVLMRQRRDAARLASENAPAPPREEAVRTNGEPATRSRKPEREPAASDAASLPPGPTSLAGTVVVLDEQGGGHPAEDGILALGLGAAGARTRHEVEVRDGRWSLQLVPVKGGERASALSVSASVLGTQIAVPAPGQAAELALPSDGRLELRMTWAAAPLLHVRAADTGRELAEVQLYELPAELRGSTHDLEHPGPDVAGRAAGSSPVRLDADENAVLGAPRVFFAVSPGYAWGRIEIDPSAAEPTLALEPTGSLELVIQGEPSLTTLEILLLEADPPHAEVVDLPRGTSRALVLDNLRSGHYLAEARDYGRLAGTRKVQVLAGQRIQEVLEVARPSAPAVPFEGVLVLPQEYGMDEFLLEFLLQGRFDESSISKGSFEIRSTAMTRESPKRYRWSANAPPARYRVELYPALPFVAEVDTGPSGTHDARIEVPPPAVVSLRCTDAETDAEIVSEKVSYLPLGSRASSPLTLAAGSPVEFRVPQGRVVISTAPGRYEPASRLIAVGPGRNEIVLRLRKKP